MLRFLDAFLTFFHSLLVLFNLLGWLVPAWRKIHMLVLGATLFAWLGIGMYIGTVGYCPLTDWHWDIKRDLGESSLPASFIKYMVDRIFQVDSNKELIDLLTGLGMVSALLGTIYTNFRREKKD